MARRSAFGRIFRRKSKGQYRPGYYARFRLHGVEVTRYAGPDRKTANDFLADVQRSKTREDLLGEKVVPAVTFAEMHKGFMAYLEARHGERTTESNRARYDRIVAHFGSRPLRDIGPGDVQDFLTYLRSAPRKPQTIRAVAKAERLARERGQTERARVLAQRGERLSKQGLGPATLNRYRSLLSLAFRYAVERGLARTNPVHGIAWAKEDLLAVPFLSAGDVDRLLASEPEARFRWFLRALADTGMRRGEALALEWRDVDLKRSVLLVRRSKSRKPREIPLTAAASAGFEALLAERGAVPMSGPDPIWPDLADLNPATVTLRFQRAARRAGFPRLRLHDLRHAFCSRLAQAGVPLPTIMELAGHATIATTMRYARHRPDNAAAEAIQRLEQPPTARPGHAASS